ncbi:MAG: archaeal heat shock protein Hsp20 [Candidatus Nezhaarchaeales archaeon]|nr:MAG: Hsp20/alpha crystallin family protein [Candidatus Nezhaarchaeota archaeon WYZ-LMO7]TDA36334.1 MAG: Hsp20/alpha crystallin family protein [Candidatus Nezhaarchaeota archaeon WYZ-LMO8]
MSEDWFESGWFGRRRRKSFWDAFFSDFEELDRMFEDFMKDFERLSREGGVKSYVYGFSVTMGPDGKPIIREFGNVKPSPRGPVVKEELEPLVDVFEEKDFIKVCAEIPGVDKEDIKVRLTDDNRLIISVDTPQRKYYKEVELPAKVDPEKTKATYRNGVLEVVLEKVEKKGKSITVE